MINEIEFFTHYLYESFRLIFTNKNLVHIKIIKGLKLEEFISIGDKYK